MKKILFLIILFFYSNFVFAEEPFSAKDITILEGILGGVKPDDSVIRADFGKDGITQIFSYIRDTTFALLALIVIGTFLFIGYKIVMSRGNPEEFKKSFMMLIYAIVGLLIVSLSWVIVMFIAGLNL